jgi:hypothetical protein
LNILRNIGAILEEKYENHFFNVIKKYSHYNTVEIMNRLLSDFPSFDDSCIYSKKRVWFLKRAQLLLSMIFPILNKDKTQLVSNELTAFADYKLPMILNHLGILQYSKKLRHVIHNRLLIPKNSQMELEIRAFTLHSIEKIREQCPIAFNSAQIDTILWNESQKIFKNYHLTITTAY